jgi:D-sedoheptulose 7-phosphate isomerase
MKKKLSDLIRKEFFEIRSLLNYRKFINNKNFIKLIDETIVTIQNGGKIFFYGNGGSASDAQHLAAELVVKYKRKRKAIPAIALSTDTSILTATANDFSFNKVFSRQIEALGKENDISLAITTSGNSKNLIEAAKIAKKKKMKTFCFSGNKGGKLKRFIKYPIIINSNNTSVIQVIEITLGQIFCNIIENSLDDSK